jgi:hypothetical protein
MRDRTRDGKRYFKPQQKITFEDWEDISDKATRAELFFKEDNIFYITMKSDLEEAKRIVYENRILEVHEEVTVTTQESEKGIIPQLRKIFIKPRKMQLDELVGQIKYISSYLAEAQSWLDLKIDLEKQEAAGTVTIERGTHE